MDMAVVREVVVVTTAVVAREAVAAVTTAVVALVGRSWIPYFLFKHRYKRDSQIDSSIFNEIFGNIKSKVVEI